MTSIIWTTNANFIEILQNIFLKQYIILLILKIKMSLSLKWLPKQLNALKTSESFLIHSIWIYIPVHKNKAI